MLAVVAELLMLRGRRGGLGVEETDELALLSMKFFGSGDLNANEAKEDINYYILTFLVSWWAFRAGGTCPAPASGRPWGG